MSLLFSRRGKRGRDLAVLTAAFAITAGSMGTTQAAAAPDTVISYRGHHFTVPDSWAVVDLAASPRTCVRFDRHAVYLGTPGSTQDCPARTFGHTEALLIRPAAAGQVARIVRDSVSRTYQANADRIGVTAT
jgi:hypothetical protein